MWGGAGRINGTGYYRYTQSHDSVVTSVVEQKLIKLVRVGALPPWCMNDFNKNQTWEDRIFPPTLFGRLDDFSFANFKLNS